MDVAVTDSADSVKPDDANLIARVRAEAETLFETARTLDADIARVWPDPTWGSMAKTSYASDKMGRIKVLVRAASILSTAADALDREDTDEKTKAATRLLLEKYFVS